MRQTILASVLALAFLGVVWARNAENANAQAPAIEIARCDTHRIDGNAAMLVFVKLVMEIGIVSISDNSINEQHGVHKPICR